MKLFSALLLLASSDVALARVGTERFLGKPTDNTDNCSAIEFKGNGFPSGKTLFKFNVLARDTSKDNNSSPFEPNGDNAILVPLKGKVDILLLNGDSDQDNSYDPRCEECRKGSDFCILTADAIQDQAELCVGDPFPNSDPCNEERFAETCDEPAEYAIFARTVGKGNASAGLCVDIDGDENCYVGSTAINPRKATDISQQLLTVCAGDVKIGLFDALCKDSDGNIVPVSDNDCVTPVDESYYWQYDNNGNRRAEFRFYSADILNELTDTNCFGVTRGGATC